MKNHLILALAVVGITACHKDSPPEVEVETICATQYPQNNQTDVNFAPLFEWCTDDSTTIWHFQLDSTEDMHTPCVDTSLNGTAYRLYRLLIPHPQATTSIPLSANEDYYWRIGKVNTDGTTSWRSVQKFNTIDVRNQIIGTHTVKKYYYDFYDTGGWFNQVYQGTVELEVTSIDNKGLRIKDLSSGLRKDVYPRRSGAPYLFEHGNIPNPPAGFNYADGSSIEFNINGIDSLWANIQTLSPPSTERGYVYKGRY